MRRFCFSDLFQSAWQCLGQSLFATSFTSWVSLYCSHDHLSTWGKAKPLLGHNLWASCTTSPTLLLPLWLYPCLSLLPQCLLSALWPDQVCSCSRDSAHGVLPAWKARPPVAAWFIPSSSGVFKYHRADFPRLLSPPIKVSCLHPPPAALCLLPRLFFPQSASSRGVTVFHSLVGDEGLQESESCAVCCCTPGLGGGPPFGRCCTVFVRIMAGIFHFLKW